jgi:hypothetical protein
LTKLTAGSAAGESSPAPIADTSWSKSLVSYWWFGVSYCGVPST